MNCWKDMNDNLKNEKVWTAAQKEAIFSPAKTLLTAASAGSGKTSVMLERVAALLERGEKLQNMLIVTFTVNAAAEMKNRLLKLLEERGKDFRREDIFLADIGTLHSFCKNLISRFFYKLGIDPGFIVAEEAETNGFKDAAADSVLSKYFESGDEVFCGLADFLAIGNRRDAALKRTIRAVYEFSHNSAEPGEWLKNAHKQAESSPDACDAKLAPFIKKLAEAALLFSKKYDELKTAEARADFIDLERLALKLLDDPEVSAYVRDKYKYVFVDEYQDINPKQEAVIVKAAGDNSLFMVGDAKQSIYGFRSCDPSIFTGKAQDTAKNTVVMLNDNFRSRPEILKFCDDVFTELMTAESCGIDYAGTSVFRAGAEFETVSDFPAVSCRFIGDGNAADEARAIADTVTRLLGEKIYIPKEKTSRAVGYGDIVILMSVVRGKYSRAVYKELVRLGLPVKSEISLNPFGLPEAKLLIDFLRVIDNPLQDIPLAAVMRSVFFKFTDNQLAEIRRAFPAEDCFHSCVMKAGQWDMFHDTQGREPCPRDTALYSKVNLFLAELRRLKAVADGVAAARLLEIICRDYNYENAVASGASGAETAGEIESFIGRVRADRRCLTLGGFIAAFDGGGGGGDGAEPAAGGTNCLRLSTIHHAKGMEFPVVILAGAGIQFTDRNIGRDIVFDKDSGIAVKTKDAAERKDKKGVFYRTAAKLFEAECMEKQRLLYVALTRAQNHLIVTGTYKAKKSLLSFLDWLKMFPSEVCEYSCGQAGEQAGAGDAETGKAVFGKPDKEYLDAYTAAPETAYPYAAAAKAPFKTTATKLSEGQRPVNSGHAACHGDTVPDPVCRETCPPDPAAVRQHFNTEGSREKGTVYHTLLKYINPGALTQNEVVAEIGRLIKEGLLSQSGAGMIDADRAAACMSSALWERARRAQEFWRERDFLYLMEGGGAETLVQGTIDLMFREGDGLVIADYKMSSLPDGEVAARYKTQLDIYAAAAESISGVPVKEKLLFLLNRGKAITIP